MSNKWFNYHNIEEIEQECREMDLNLKFSSYTDVFNQDFLIEGKTVPNRLAIQPMEGYDSNVQGGPGDLTSRRYERYARGGAGLIWFEAVAILEEARSNSRQLLLTEENLPDFAELIEMIKSTAADSGLKERPYCVIQLTHSGRFSKPTGTKKPLIVVHDSLLDNLAGLDENYPILTDEQLKGIQKEFVKKAKLAYQAGFDAVDIKSCHKYLISELLGARNRSGLYGGSYENRTRFLKEVLAMIREEVPQLTLALRLNLTDLTQLENSWGMKEQKVDLKEPLKLIKELEAMGVKLINISAGTPYYNPHVMRPFEKPVRGGYEQPEHPLKGVDRLLELAAVVQERFPELAVVGSGYSWLRQFGGKVAAWNIASKRSTFAGFGRQAFAYPSFAADLIRGKGMEAGKCCTACSRCSQLMIWGSKTGCVIRDAGVYADIYKNASPEV